VSAQILGCELPKLKDQLLSFRNCYEEAHKKVTEHMALGEDTLEKINEKKLSAYELYFKYLPEFSDEIKNALKGISLSAYTKIYQQVGDNIRASGKANKSQFDPEKIFLFPKTINKIIKSARYAYSRENRPCHIVIDAIRNPYEAVFLKERYADFYLISINTSNENRLKHLQESHKFSTQQIKELDEKEYPEKLEGYNKYTSQNIQKCIEIADIHINNPKNDNYGTSELSCQLAWYVSLMMHPGLVMPSSIENCMQIAYSAKKSSGCISRQVGAVVTDNTYSIKSVGWNNSAQGQVPCILRSAENLLSGIDNEAYSFYERNDHTFRETISNKYSNLIAHTEGRNLSFCFKDIQNEIENQKNQKNQVHTRSLHAEENAFLQISKHGGQQIKGGYLFTTASPCELCAKKAYQLGITKIYYIDPYPGIATSHILNCGQNSPELLLFRGALGSAYHRLYQPIMPYKDELEMAFLIPKKGNSKTTQIKRLENENNVLKAQVEDLKKQLERRNTLYRLCYLKGTDLNGTYLALLG
jgi:deoxycytidylate deaminase/cell division protein FtsB